MQSLSIFPVAQSIAALPLASFATTRDSLSIFSQNNINQIILYIEKFILKLQFIRDNPCNMKKKM